MMRWSLVAASILYGAGSCWLFLRIANVRAIHTNVRRMQAFLYELLLYSAEPALAWRAQKALVVENLRFLRLILPAVVILGLPTAWLLVQFEDAFGHDPLPLNEPAVVTVQVEGIPPTGGFLKAPSQIAVESSPVRVLSDSQISWRIRPLLPVSSSMTLTVGDRSFEKSISAGARTFDLPSVRGRSWLQYALHPSEPRLPPGDLLWVEVPYPRNRAWIVWFLLISTASAVIVGRWVV